MNDGKIAVLHTEASLGFGGQERRILRELERLDPARFRGLLLCQPGSKLGQVTEARGIPTFRLKMRAAFDPIAFIKILRLLRRERVDIIHAHSSRDAWLVGAAGKLLGVKVFRTRHLLTRIGGRLVYTRLTDFVLTVSEGVRQYLISAGVPAAKIVAVPTGIDLKRFDPGRKDLKDVRAEFGLRPDDFVVGIVAVLRFNKGHHHLIRAVGRLAPRHPNLKLVIVGDGPQKQNIDKLVEELGLEQRVMRVGHYDDIPSVLKALDAFALPTREEALGTALIEATAMGVPVIATKVGGIPEVLGEAGVYTPTEDADALARNIEALIGDSARRARLRDQGMERARALYDENLMVRRTETLYRQALGSTT